MPPTGEETGMPTRDPTQTLTDAAAVASLRVKDSFFLTTLPARA
jgi:hypothetical protein